MLEERTCVTARKATGPKDQCTTYKIAHDYGELGAALRLVYQVYLRRGLIGINPRQMRMTPFHLLSTTKVLIAANQDHILCTLSVISDGLLGVPMETIYPQEVAARRESGIRFAEISCLADRRDGMQHSSSIVFRLMALTAQYTKYHGLDQLFIAVHPRHTSFYRRFLAFEVIGEERRYTLMHDHPAVAMVLDLNTIERDNPRAYKRLFGTPFGREVF